MFIVVKRAPLVQLDVESNEVTSTITTGPDDDVRAQFERAERLALAEQRRLRGDTEVVRTVRLATPAPRTSHTWRYCRG
jgi:hypothetical protein